MNCRPCRWTIVLLLFATGVSAARAAQPAATDASAPKTNPVSLSPFEVNEGQELGYTASTAMSGTRTNEKLENLPNSISVMTQEFLQDLALNNYFDAVDFAMSAENIANDLGTVGAVVGDRSGNQVNIRGLATVRQLRDGFPWYLAADVYNTERIEFSRGPGGLAYGDVDAGGIINIASKRATFRQRGSTQVRYDNFGTQRYSLDFNQPLVPGRLGLRVNAIKSEVEMFKQRMGRDLEGYAGAVRWEPFKHRRTQIDVTYETGNTTAHLGHLGPTDSRIAYVRGTGTSALDADPSRTGTQTNGVGMQQLRAPTAVAHAIVDVGGVINNWQSTTANTFRITTTNTAAAAVSATDPQNPSRFPLRRIPESIIPLGQDWAGPDNKQNSKYYAYTIEFKHSFTPRLYGLLAHNGQVDETFRKQTYSSLASVGGVAGRSVHIDVNPVLPNPNGPGVVPNPNYEQMYLVHAPLFNPDGHQIANWRAQLVYDVPLKWGISQRLVAGANYRHEDNYQDNFGYSLTKEEIAKRGFTGTAAYYNNNLVYPIHYLKDGNSDAALGWSVRPGLTQLFRHNAGSGVNRRLDQSLTSGSVNLLGAYFKGRVRTSLGLSREHWVQSASLPSRADTANFNEQRFTAADGSLMPNDGTKKINPPLVPFADDWSTNQTYGAVWHAVSWLSLTAGYFESSQFSDNYGTDLTGRALAPLTGEGYDLSARLHLFQGRVEASVTRFATKQENIDSTIASTVRDELNPLLATPFANLVDYRDRTSTGWEYQVVTNLTRHWTLLATYSTNTTEYTRFFPLLGQLVTAARTAAQARGLNPDDATILTREYLEDQEGNIAATKRSTASVTTRYTFTEGLLKGFTTGVSARYARGRARTGVTIAGVEVLPPITTDDVILANPFFSYRRKFGRYQTTLQLNINNVFDEKIDVGNSYTWARYTEPRQYVTTLTVAF
jgi:outer membrane receptor for ferric coprogen and ferric-rhodotorulic acid